MKQQSAKLSIGNIVKAIAALFAISFVASLLNPGVRENRNQPKTALVGAEATNAYLRSTPNYGSVQEVPVIDPTHPPTVPPPTPRIVIPTIVDSPEPPQVVATATPRLLKIEPIFDVKLVMGKRAASVDKLLGKPTGIDDGMEVGEQLRTYDLQGYMVIISFGANKLAKEAMTLLMNRDGFTLADSSLLFTRFGLDRVGAPDIRGESGATWENVNGLQLHVGASEDTFIENTTIALQDPMVAYKAPTAAPRDLSPLFNAKSVIGKSARSVDRVLGKPTSDPEELNDGWKLRSYDVGGHKVDITFNADDAAVIASISGLDTDGYMLSDWKAFWKRFGLQVTRAPDEMVERGARWANVSGLDIDYVSGPDKLIALVTIGPTDQ